MKFDSKRIPSLNKVAPNTFGETPDCCLLFHSNKCIPNGDAPLQKEETNNMERKESILGSTIRYVVTLIVTPVKTTTRFPKRPDTVDAEEIKALATLLSRLSMDGKELKEEVKTDETASSKVSNDTEYDETTIENDVARITKKLGRFETTDTTHKSVIPVKVIRSHRLE